MKCVILQPSYIPWRGYFHQIHKADVFVFYDDVQYDDWGWRNRNRIKTEGAAKVVHSGSAGPGGSGSVDGAIVCALLCLLAINGWRRRRWAPASKA